MITQENQPSSLFWLALGGFCSNLIGMGIGRFAYTPVLMLYVSQGWLNAAQANYLGFTNFAGYLLGALTAWRIAGKFLTPSTWIKSNAILCCLSLLACAYNAGFAWFLVWRFLAGFACAILTIITPSAILKKTPAPYFGRVNGSIFTGMSCGIILSGCLVPLLSHAGLSFIWLSFAIVASLALLVVLFALKPLNSLPVLNVPIATDSSDTFKENTPIVKGLSASYALAGVAFIPHALFLAAYLTNLGFTTRIIGAMWMAFGTGGVLGTMFAGYLGDKLGIQKTLCGALLTGSLMLILTALLPIEPVLFFTSFMVGMLLPSTVTLTSAAVKVAAAAHHRTWARVTIYFAIGQTLGSYLISFLLARHFAFTYIFLVGAVSFIFAAGFVLRAQYVHAKFNLIVQNA